MDLVKEAQKLRLQKIKAKEKKRLHGWLLTGKESKYIRNKIYTTYDNDDKYIEITQTTTVFDNPYPCNWECKYQGLVNEYLGNMPIKPDIHTIIEEDMTNRYIN
jgi:hypothetical protein